MDEIKGISLESRKLLLYSLMMGEEKQEIKDSSSHDAWRIFSKAKGALEDGARLENISWRLFHMKLNEKVVLN
jgi:hypothetical protein